MKVRVIGISGAYPAANGAISYVYNLNTGKLVAYGAWTKGFDGYAGFGSLQSE